VAENAIDGSTATNWRTQYTGGNPAHAHEIQIDLGSAYDVDTLRYYPRQDGSANGRIQNYKVYVSENGNEWGNAVAGGTFANNSSEKQVLFSPKSGQYIRLVALDEFDGGNDTSVAEINVEGVCEEPSVILVDPVENALKTGLDLSVSASVCLDAVLYPGWGVKFKLDGGSAVTVTSPPFNVLFTGVAFGDHTVTAAIVDASGAAVAGDRTFDSVSLGVGHYYVAIGDSITAGSGDFDMSDNGSQDGRNHEGGFTPILNDLLTQAKGYPHTVELEGIPGYTSAQGLARLSHVLQVHPLAEYFLILYGTNDAIGLFPVPSGQGLSPGDGNYPGSLKDNLQQIIDTIELDGRTAYLSKVPYTQDAAANITIQEYNQVISSLAASNGISVVPPDFYSHFESNPGELYDSVHPTAIGYQSMGTLWLNALP